MSKASMKASGKLALLLLLLVHGTALAQDLEPRRWSQLPTGVNFVGVGLGYTEGDTGLDPVLRVEDLGFKLTSGIAAYIRTFGLLGKSARFDVAVPYFSGSWEGRVDGVLTKVNRDGFGDPRFRLSMLLYGGPAETPEVFAKSEKSSTVIGTAITVTVPVGEYFPDKLINLGQNRWVIRPQIGVAHTSGRWTYELTGSVFLYTDNDDFFGETELENEPLYAVQGHLIYTFRPGLWTSLSTAYGSGANATISGVSKDAETKNWLTALSVGLPISRRQGVKLTYLRARTQLDIGSESNSVVLSYSQMF